MKDTDLEACIHLYGKELYSFLCRLTGSREEADDLYQDTFLKLMEIGKGPDFTRNPKSYLLTIAVQIWKNRRRKYAWRQRITGGPLSLDEGEWEIPAEKMTAEEEMISREEKRAVQDAVQRLPLKYRLPILLFYMEELKIAEISGILKISQGTVKSRLNKAKKMLEKELEVVFHEN